MTILFTVYWVELSGQHSSDSNYFLKAFRINSGVGYYRETDLLDNHFNEVTWLNQVSFTLTQALYVGVVVNAIYTWKDDRRDENYFLKGVFIQYDLTKNRKPMIFLELNYMQGDYCHCGQNEPFRKSGLQYIGFGAGIDYPIFRSNFYFSASFIFHRILEDVEDKSNYNIPTIGISYRVGKPKYQ